MRLFLIGKGGREHALAWKLAQSPLVEHIYVVPGNGGTAQGIAKVSNLSANTKDYPGLVTLAKEYKIDLVVVGPDDEVVDGIEGYFKDCKLPRWNLRQ
jgi:phosphoribosylamine--glycine ligase / phosphoribosylformylglycinamidine cyclo-ligase